MSLRLMEHTFLAHTWDQYEKGANAQLPVALRTDGPTHFCLFPLALGVSAIVTWKKVLDDEEIDPSADHDDEENDLSYDSFTNSVSLFLEEVAGLTFIGDAAIRWLCLAKKPAAMAPDVYFRRRATVLTHLDCRLLRTKLSRPSAYELAEAVFLAFPKTYQEKYAETHNELEEDLTPLRSAFMQYHAADMCNGTLDRLKKAKESKKRPSDSHGKRSGKRGRRQGNYSSGRSRRGGYRNDRDRRDQYDDRRDRQDRPRGDHKDQGDCGGNRGNYKPGQKTKGDRGRPYKGQDQAHHMSDDGSYSRRSDQAHHMSDDGSYSRRSRSPSRSPSGSRSGRSRSPSGSPLIGDEEQAYAMSAGHSPCAQQEAPIENLTYDDEVRSRHKKYYNSRRWKSLFKKKDSSHSKPRR